MILRIWARVMNVQMKSANVSLTNLRNEILKIGLPFLTGPSEINGEIHTKHAKENVVLQYQTCQPPCNPDSYVLDLGYLNYIQSIQYQSFSKNIDHLIPLLNFPWRIMLPKE